MTSDSRDIDQISMSWLVTKWVRLAFLLLASSTVCHSQNTGQLYTFFKQNIGLNDSEIARIEQGKAVAKVLDSSTPSQVFVFGAVFINAQRPVATCGCQEIWTGSSLFRTIWRCNASPTRHNLRISVDLELKRMTLTI